MDFYDEVRAKQRCSTAVHIRLPCTQTVLCSVPRHLMDFYDEVCKYKRLHGSRTSGEIKEHAWQIWNLYLDPEQERVHRKLVHTSQQQRRLVENFINSGRTRGVHGPATTGSAAPSPQATAEQSRGAQLLEGIAEALFNMPHLKLPSALHMSLRPSPKASPAASPRNNFSSTIIAVPRRQRLTLTLLVSPHENATPNVTPLPPPLPTLSKRSTIGPEVSWRVEMLPTLEQDTLYSTAQLDKIQVVEALASTPPLTDEEGGDEGGDTMGVPLQGDGEVEVEDRPRANTEERQTAAGEAILSASAVGKQIDSEKIFDEIISRSVNTTIEQDVIPAFAESTFFEKYLAIKFPLQAPMAPRSTLMELVSSTTSNLKFGPKKGIERADTGSAERSGGGSMISRLSALAVGPPRRSTKKQPAATATVSEVSKEEHAAAQYQEAACANSGGGRNGTSS
ncbi:hypothetical protein JKP88DRAFT_244632 [Tribonema minus]|uniref:Uncharacterized protein n=1 Tax=Tribonema minus TaxID=303371 RepID=A0A836CFJ2_9STRA|nr:hypothetical protein JKP88DRAFT_244632 [Tribonema minus]